MWFPYYIQFLIYSVGVNVFLLFTCVIYYSDVFLTNFNRNLLQEYDYIIVGAGTAGSLIGHRLATETNFTFMVFEAGGRSHFLYEIPIIGPLLHGSVYDWQFETTPQENACLAMVDRKCKLTQGKIVGGSSKLNNMIHIRGNLSHYAEWFHGVHNEEYIRQHFDFLEEYFLNIDDIPYQSEMTDAILDAAKELGYEKLDKHFKKGFSKSRVTHKNGKRWTTSDMLDLNKHVTTNALVEKVLIINNKSFGVSVRISDKTHIVLARKGVILSAGTLNTPKILQLSGVGPSKLLKSLNIPIIQDLPVGLNLQDHVGSGLDLILLNKTLSVSAANIINPLNLFHYIQGKGPWTNPGCEVLGFLSTKNLTTPDIEIMVLPVGIASDRGSLLRKLIGISDEVWNEYFTKTFNYHTATFFTVILHPKSKGNVFIKSTDPEIPPLVNPRYLSAKEDVDTLITGLKLAIKFIKTDSLKAIEAHLNTNSFPGCTQFPFFSDAYLECYVRHLTLTSYHPVGTCSMGLSDSKNSVVDTSFRVLNIQNLYIADASILPTLPSGNINAAVTVMANIFFEKNIKHVSHNSDKVFYCHSYDQIYQYLFKICSLK
ncbi:unnamed protein product [Parnassius mnemosyne]|uniref:Glucose-methanol-choline oxidoreductase N-terminal domain-containing protein n=1 Tax=Parnassius mnemosyne TaxID=213953 RepID=A0AAV1LJX7_9NEOP